MKLNYKINNKYCTQNMSHLNEALNRLCAIKETNLISNIAPDETTKYIIHVILFKINIHRSPPLL